MSLMDPEDQQFGHKAAEDQDKVDALEEKGVTEDELSNEPPRKEPRAGRKAEEPMTALIRGPLAAAVERRCQDIPLPDVPPSRIPQGKRR
jgi:hypothetical protein